MQRSKQQAGRLACAGWKRLVRRWATAGVVSCAASCLVPELPLYAAPTATASRAAREEAVAEIPFDRLKADVRAKLLSVVEKPSIYRRLPERTIECDPDMYLFLVRYPEVVVNIWELMGVTNVKLQRVGDYTFECSDGAGTVGTVELVYGTHDLHILYAEATYEGTLTGRKVHGRGVMILKSNYKQDKEHRLLVENRLDVFVQIDQVGAELMAKTLQPLVGKAADVNFEESAAFVARVSQAAESNGPGMQRLAAKLKNVAPEVRSEFASVSAIVSQRAAERQQAISAAGAAPPVARSRPATTPQLRR